MKNLLLIVSIFVFQSTTYAQSFIKIKVPMVLEDKKVDSLIDAAIKEGSPNSFCIRIYVWKFDYGYEFDVSGLNTDIKAIDLGYGLTNNHMMEPMDTDNLRYFKYGGVTVFISGTDEPFGIFKTTKTVKTFIFTNTLIEADKKYPTSRVFYIRYYNFIDGNFINAAVGNR